MQQQPAPLRVHRVTVVVVAFAIAAFGAVWIGSRATNSQTPRFDPQQVALGQKVYMANCAACHGAKLEGQPNWKQELPTGGRPAPPHDASGHTWHHDDALLFAIVKNGKDALNVPGYQFNMPAFRGKLSDEEIRAALVYIASTWPPETQSARATRLAQENK